LERAIICYLFDQRLPLREINAIKAEMCSLTETAGAVVVLEIVQKKSIFDKKYLIGRGKLLEIKNLINPLKINLVIFYNSLSTSQLRNLEKLLEIKIIDRTALILDIFAQHARSNEGKLQIELAQLLYLLPRLSGKGIELSRLGGGIGTRGPGETKLETDRRVIKKRITLIKNRLQELKKQRQEQRKSRLQQAVPIIALAGYTSAGKSTLFKTLSSEEVKISNLLFSTLDPLLRRISLDEFQKGAAFLLSDTVGFIRQMPEELLISFNATLEELHFADLILHIIDINSEDLENQKRVVENTLQQLGVDQKRVITVFNKIDLASPELIENYRLSYPQALFISALKQKGITELKRYIFERCFQDYSHYQLQLPLNFNIINLQKWAIVCNVLRREDHLEVNVFASKKNYETFLESKFEKDFAANSNF